MEVTGSSDPVGSPIRRGGELRWAPVPHVEPPRSRAFTVAVVVAVAAVLAWAPAAPADAEAPDDALGAPQATAQGRIGLAGVPEGPESSGRSAPGPTVPLLLLACVGMLCTGSALLWRRCLDPGDRAPTGARAG